MDLPVSNIVGVTAWSTFLDGFTSVMRPHQTGIATPFNDTNHLATIVAADIWPGLDLSALGIDRGNAMKIAAAAKCRNLVCGAIAGMPLVAMRDNAPIGVDRQSALITQPEAGRPRAVTLAWTADQLIWYGRAWWHITDRYADGRPMHVRLLPEADVTYDPVEGTVQIAGDHIVHPETDFIRIDGLNEGILTYGRDVLARAALTEMSAARAGSNPVPSIELHQTEGAPLSAAEIDALVARWAAAREGKYGGVAFTGPTVDVKTHGQAAEQLLIAARNTAALDVARAFGLPAWAVDATVEGSSLTYSNVPSRSRELLDYTLHPIMDAVAGRLSMDDVLARGQWCRLDPRRLLRGDFTDRMNAGATAVASGIYTAAEVRAMELEAPLEGT